MNEFLKNYSVCYVCESDMFKADWFDIASKDRLSRRQQVICEANDVDGENGRCPDASQTSLQVSRLCRICLRQIHTRRAKALLLRAAGIKMPAINTLATSAGPLNDGHPSFFAEVGHRGNSLILDYQDVCFLKNGYPSPKNQDGHRHLKTGSNFNNFLLYLRKDAFAIKYEVRREIL